MVPTNLRTLTVLVLVCAVATGGFAAGVNSATDLAVGSDERPAVTDRTAADPADSASSTAGEAEARQQDDPVEIEPGETVTGEVNESDRSQEYVFEMEPGQRATITYTSTAPPRNTTRIYVETPDGRILPDKPLSRLVNGGVTKNITFLTNEAGMATIHVGSTGTLRPEYGTYELSLELERTGEVPDEPNDDRANATELEVNTTKAAELADEFGETDTIDHYTFTLPEYETPDDAGQARVPVTVTVDREQQDGVTALNVDTAPAGQPSDTTTRYVGTSNPVSVEFVGTGGSQYYIAVVDVNNGDGPYNLTVQVDGANVTVDPAPPGNETQTLDEISQAAYGVPFDELSDPTSELVRAVHDRQASESKLSKDDLAQMRYDMDYEELSEETQDEITTLYRAQFVNESG